VGPRAGLDLCGGSRPNRDSIPGHSSPWRVTITTELSRTTYITNIYINIDKYIRYKYMPIPVVVRSKAARRLQSRFRIPPRAWMFFCRVCSVLSGRGLCDELITRPEDLTDCGVSSCVIKKPRERGGHSPRWAAVSREEEEDI
jgi:hypothetical protein